MGEQAHTAGPWVTAGNGSAATLVRAGNPTTGQRIATTFCSHGTGNAEGNLRRIRENEANARLIASAPDLLEALRQLTENAVTARGCGLKNDDDGIVSSALFDTIMQARAVYAKATGAAG